MTQIPAKIKYTMYQHDNDISEYTEHREMLHIARES